MKQIITYRQVVMIAALLALGLMVVAWQDISGNTINPRYVQRIKDGQTSKHEIMAMFGDPKEVERTPQGPIYKYFSYKDAPPKLSSKMEREVTEQSSSPYFLDEEKKVKKVTKKTEGKVLRGILTIRFKPDGETVLSHEYEEK
jgi:hypothetical protein